MAGEDFMSSLNLKKNPEKNENQVTLEDAARNEYIEDKRVMRLMKKSRKGILRLLFSRVGIMAILLLTQIVLIYYIFEQLRDYSPYYIYFSTAFSAAMVFVVINSSMDSTARLTWMFLIMLAPAFGAPLYAYTQMEVGHRRLRREVVSLTKISREMLKQDPVVLERLKKESPDTAALAHYIGLTGNYPVYQRTSVTFFPMGEDKFREMVRQLKMARHFIFMEYFIVDEGLMWGTILQILADKVKEGVEVRVMIDGMCEFSTLPGDYPKRLEKLGIACKMFSPLTPFVSTYYNYRDHRKILVIDGHTAFTGGVNLADEYINHIDRFGKWKDTAIMLKGEAVSSFCLMFLQMWNVRADDLDIHRWHRYLEVPEEEKPEISDDHGYVIPYADNPMDDYKIGEDVYMDILARANSYVHIMTPYLILDGEAETALKTAAHRGVEVVIILPGIPDKKVAYSLAKSHYKSLLRAGVKIYEYTPGFVHAKLFVSDDKKAVVGTINLDYRSLYHHFECAAYLYENKVISEIEADFVKTLKDCRQISLESLKKEKLYYRIVGKFAKILAPLM